MAFVKLYKVMQDGAVGYQTINQLAENAADLRAQMLTEHGGYDPSVFHSSVATGFGPPAPAPIPYDQLGHHNITEIPRGVAQTLIFSQFAGFGTFSTGVAWNTPGITSVQWVSTGVYFLPVVGLSTFWAKVTPLVAVGITALEPQVRQINTASYMGTISGLRVSLFKLVGAAFVADDQAFTVVLHGNP